MRENKDDAGRRVKLTKALMREFPTEKQYLRSIPFG
jgi:hypothetical protein